LTFAKNILYEADQPLTGKVKGIQLKLLRLTQLSGLARSEVIRAGGPRHCQP